ncbi:MAG: hypothetical protein K2W96_20510, partial [Gemmataceae bacterium]|nr:hypothetical protein [Gemmataceae bacterium]
MTVNRRRKLLAKVAALWGLCLAGAGCHSNLVDRYLAAPPGHPPAPPAATMAAPVPASGLRQVSGELPAISSSPPASLAVPVPSSPAAMIGRPVRPTRGIFSARPAATMEPPSLLPAKPAPVGTPPGAPIQRVSAGMPRGAMDKPFVVGYRTSA